MPVQEAIPRGGVTAHEAHIPVVAIAAAFIVPAAARLTETSAPAAPGASAMATSRRRSARNGDLQTAAGVTLSSGSPVTQSLAVVQTDGYAVRHARNDATVH